MYAYFIPMAIYLFSGLLHPIHVSVCDMEFDQKDQEIKMTMRIFIDDLEKELRAETGEERMDVLNPPEKYSTDSLFSTYLTKHLTVKINGKPVSYHYLGHEVEDASVYCYMLIRQTPSLKTVQVFNDILMDAFDDQVNLVHVEVEEETHTMMFKGDKKTDQLEF